MSDFWLGFTLGIVAGLIAAGVGTAAEVDDLEAALNSANWRIHRLHLTLRRVTAIVRAQRRADVHAVGGGARG